MNLLMVQYIHRYLEQDLKRGLAQFPVVAILGSRQCGKSTLAKKVIRELGNSIYLDLEVVSDLSKLNDPEAFLRANQDKLVCLDEIQRLPEIFPLIRGLTDITRRSGQILVLGSASPELLRQTSESLAGRIDFIDLTPFLISELPEGSQQQHWIRGGYPDSFLAPSDAASWRWRGNMIRTYLEQDVPNFGFNISTQTLQHLWMMLAHTSGQLLNTAKLADSLGVSRTTVTFYIDILEKTYMVRVLRPLFTNLKKRLVKSPKVYLRDTGLMHHLLNIEDQNSLLGHPSYGGSWETYALEQICASLDYSWKPAFYRTSNGAEIDLVLEKGLRRVAVELKASTAPKATRGLHHAMQDLDITEAYIVAPLPEETTYPYREGVTITTVAQLPSLIANL